MYDGLVRLTGGTGMPGFEPSLAAEMPTANTDATVWTVKLRDGVTFSDGSTFDAADVVATYKAILDPASASEARSSYDMISDVVAVDDSTVEFRLAYSYAPLLTKMLIGMVPSESLATPGLAAESPLNTAPSVRVRTHSSTSHRIERSSRRTRTTGTVRRRSRSSLSSTFLTTTPAPNVWCPARSTEPISLHCLPIRSRARTTCP